MEKGSFQKSPFSRDSTEFREPTNSRQAKPPDCGKQRRIRAFSRDSREFRDSRDSRDSSREKTPFVMTPFSVPDKKISRFLIYCCKRVRPLQGPKIGKRGFRGQKTPISQCPRKGRFELKNPHFSAGLHNENGEFSAQSAVFEVMGNGSFLTPKPSFPDFEDFDHCYSRGRMRSQIYWQIKTFSEIIQERERHANLRKVVGTPAGRPWNTISRK